ncbi:MAG: bifunctional 5,10-methylene-tetrahydrofolate dehydrogenase/5,10-methylene-tetrahydrofolate cyclohydrolase [Bacteroidales bacterium]|nr:bifunctional 5,10-methylene-tetrahydrofolate dehydrogenase/5,10-methylene-tetrahydrofolate cyclohydrolase [Bacteroidales bacterium]
MVILDGKATSEKIKLEIAQMVKDKVAAGGKRPHLAAILVGNDGASQTYVGNKERACAQVGFNSTLHRFPAEITQVELIRKIDEINRNDDVDGLIVQLPLPGHIDEDAVINAIDPSKDVDGFHPVNVGKMTLGLPTFLPATPYGILRLLDEYGIETSGKHCVIIGRSNIVGRPLANLMSLKDNPGDCTVTICHSRTKNIELYTKQADIIIAALGSPGFLKGDMVREGTVIVDVGITRISDPSKKSGYRLEGDVDFESVAPKASYITPVPGGVGPMTIVSLMVNTLKAAEGK